MVLYVSTNQLTIDTKTYGLPTNWHRWLVDSGHGVTRPRLRRRKHQEIVAIKAAPLGTPAADAGWGRSWGPSMTVSDG